jgi:hypothetical protein
MMTPSNTLFFHYTWHLAVCLVANSFLDFGLNQIYKVFWILNTKGACQLESIYMFWQKLRNCHIIKKLYCILQPLSRRVAGTGWKALPAYSEL